MSENQNETPTIDDAVEETRDLIDRMASAIKNLKGSQTAINAQDIPNEIRDIINQSHVTKTYYDVRSYLSDIGDLLRPYVDFSLDTTNLSSWLNSVPRNDFTNTYTYKYKNSYATHFANRGKLYTESALQTIIEKCSELAREDFDMSKAYLTILEYQELYNEAHTRVTDFCLYLYKQVYTISEYQGITVYTLESDTNVARLNISAGNTLSISSIITENIPQRADINSTSMDSPIYNAANCVLYGYNYYDNVLNKMTVRRVNTINAQDFPDAIRSLDTRYIGPDGNLYEYKWEANVYSGNYVFYSHYPFVYCTNYKDGDNYYLLTGVNDSNGNTALVSLRIVSGTYNALINELKYPLDAVLASNAGIVGTLNGGVFGNNWAWSVPISALSDTEGFSTIEEAYEAITGKYVGPDGVAYTYHYYGDGVVSGRTYGVDAYSNVKVAEDRL